MLRRFTGSTTRRISIAVLAVMILLLAAYAWHDYRENLREWRIMAEHHASEVLGLAALSVAYEMREGNRSEARRTLTRFFDRRRPDDATSALLFGVRGIQLRDAGGAPVAKGGQTPDADTASSGSSTVKTHGPDEASGARISTRWLDNEGGLSASGPIFHSGQYVGTLAIDFDTSSLEGFFKRHFGGYAIYLPCTVLATLMLTLIFIHWIMHPLKHAIQVLPEIGEGSVALRTLTTRRDEYGELGRAIEFADQRIHEARKRLQTQQSDLEKTQIELNRFKRTLDQTLDCVFMFKPENLQFFYANTGAVRQVGYSSDELYEMTVLDIKPEYDEKRFRELIEPLIRGTRDSITFETVHRHKDGSLIPVEIFLQYISPANEPGRFVAIVRDISERKHTERELELHRQHLEELVAARSATIREQVSIINQTHDSVVTTDLDGIISSWNRGSEQLFGVNMDQAIGRHISFVYPRDEHDYLQQEVIAPLKEKGEHETEVRMHRADGSEFFAHLSLSMLYDENGAPKGMVIYSIDITERKRREALLQTTSSHLQASNRELESFCYTVSHDLRAPLRAIHGFSQVLSEDYDDKLDDVAKDYLRRIRAGADNMGRIIDALLQLSRVTRRELKFSRVDLSALAERSVAGLRERDPHRRVEVDIQPGVTALGDEGLLQILMENLLGNAWKYTGRTEHARLEFGVEGDTPEPVYYVRDNGAGFDMRYADQLFGTFQRLHQAHEFPGTGIGLATVHRIVERHGGTIRGEGRPGHGACFYFSLPQQTPGTLGPGPV